MTSRHRTFDPYATLGVDANAGAMEVKRAYRERVLQCHPDRDPSPLAAERFRQVHAAYRLLSDPVQRARYDFGLQHPHPVRHPSRKPAAPRTAPDAPDRPIPRWLFRGLHLAGLLFGLGCVCGVVAGYLFFGWPQYTLFFMLPGLAVLPDSWAGLVMNRKTPVARGSHAYR